MDAVAGGGDRVHVLTGGLTTSVRSIWDRLTWMGLCFAVVLVGARPGAGRWSPARSACAASITAGIAVAVAWQAAGRVRVGWAASPSAASSGAPAPRRGRCGRTRRAVVTMSLATRGQGAMLAFAIGLLALLDKPQRPVARLARAEGLMIAASVLFACWVTVLPTAFAASAGRALDDQIQLMAYPISDVLLMGVVVFAITKLPALGQGGMLLFPGIGAIAILSTATSEPGPAASASPGVVGLAIALAFSAIAAAGAHVAGRSDDQRPPWSIGPRLLLLAAPGLSILIVVGTTSARSPASPWRSSSAWITIGVLTLSVLLHLR